MDNFQSFNMQFCFPLQILKLYKQTERFDPRYKHYRQDINGLPTKFWFWFWPEAECVCQCTKIGNKIRHCKSIGYEVLQWIKIGHLVYWLIFGTVGLFEKKIVSGNFLGDHHRADFYYGAVVNMTPVDSLWCLGYCCDLAPCEMIVLKILKS